MTCSYNSIALRIYSLNDLNIEDIKYDIAYSVIYFIELVAICWAYRKWHVQRKYDPRRDKIIGHAYFQSTIYVLLFSIVSYLVLLLLPVNNLYDQRYANLCIFNSVYETMFFLFAKVVPCFLVIYQASISIGIMQFQLQLSRFLNIVKIVIFVVFAFLCISIGAFIGVISDLYNYYPQEVIFPFEIGVLVCSLFVIGLQMLLLQKKESQYGHLLSMDQRVEHKRILYLNLVFLIGMTLMIASDVICYVISQFDISPIYRIISSIVGYLMMIACQVASYFPPKQILFTYETDEELINVEHEFSSF